jgi:hypothetical protein
VSINLNTLQKVVLIVAGIFASLPIFVIVFIHLWVGNHAIYGYEYNFGTKIKEILDCYDRIDKAMNISNTEFMNINNTEFMNTHEEINELCKGLMRDLPN